MKKYILLMVCVLIVMSFLFIFFYEKSRKPVMETFNVDSVTREEITDELIVALFIENITSEITKYYSNIYLGEIEVYNYEVKVLDVWKKEPGLISVKFGVTPQVGAHNPLGYDELVYHVDSRGNKILSGYEHLKNY